MYHDFYGFQVEPFSLTPDSRFLFLSRRHEEALAALVYGVRHRKGFIAITGEVGSGKTTLCRTFMAYLDKAGTQIALVLNPDLNEVELLQTICAEFGLPDQWASKRNLLNTLNQFLLQCAAAGQNAVLIIDEAQNIPPRTIEQVRMISNLETETEKLIQIVLAGQPELDDLLHRPELRQLNQRITVRYHLEPLDAEEVGQYIAHRILIAKPNEPVFFSDEAVALVAKESEGTPRRINVLCDRALLVAYVDETRTIERRHIEKAILEVSGTRPRRTLPMAIPPVPAPSIPPVEAPPTALPPVTPAPRMTTAMTSHPRDLPGELDWPVTPQPEPAPPPQPAAPPEQISPAPTPGGEPFAAPSEPAAEPVRAEPPPPGQKTPVPESASVTASPLAKASLPPPGEPSPPPPRGFPLLPPSQPAEGDEAWSSVPISQARVPETPPARKAKPPEPAPASVVTESQAEEGTTRPTSEVSSDVPSRETAPPWIRQQPAAGAAARPPARARGLKIFLVVALFSIAAGYLAVVFLSGQSRRGETTGAETAGISSKADLATAGQPGEPVGPVGEETPGREVVGTEPAAYGPPGMIPPSELPGIVATTATPGPSPSSPQSPRAANPPVFGELATPEPTPSEAQSPQPTRTSRPTPRKTALPTRSATPARTAAPTPSPSASASPSASQTPPPSATPPATPSPSATARPSPSPKETDAAAPSPTSGSYTRWSVDPDGVVRVDLDILTQIASLLTWLRMMGKPVDMKPLSSQPPERVADLELATGRSPLWLRKAELPANFDLLVRWNCSCLVRFGVPGEGGSTWAVLDSINDNQVRLLDPRNGAVDVPAVALSTTLLEAVGLYMDPDDLAVARPGDEGRRVERLRDLLRFRGLLPPPDSESAVAVYDRALSSAVAAFQEKNGLQSTGILNAPTAWLLLTLTR